MSCGRGSLSITPLPSVLLATRPSHQTWMLLLLKVGSLSHRYYIRGRPISHPVWDYKLDKKSHCHCKRKGVDANGVQIVLSCNHSSKGKQCQLIIVYV